ncbi:DNA-methyltransferase [Tepidibacter mesophilus]|uniref:DNA-methyltransferase n=1 Tax=Tepidibacter mesophilus TaxID=655607 RepID=UPI002E8DD4A2|nr:site-specific DNA-methyltransferase [Tepidibacter mesophilus]
MELNKIYNMDCLEGMKLIKDCSVDMILCDLPYGTTRCKWDSIIPLDKLWDQYERIIKDNGAIVLFAQTPFDKILGCSNLKLLRYEWIWEKTQATGHLNVNKAPLKAHENILIFYKKAPTYNPQKTYGHKPINNYTKYISTQNKSELYGKLSKEINGGGETDRYPRDILVFSSDKQTCNLHPTQKPVALLEYLIKTYTNENEIVLDNCMGSGSTAVAAINTNRKYTGFELDKNYYETAVNRINNYQAQYQLKII